jgi:hypothetical protein
MSQPTFLAGLHYSSMKSVKTAGEICTVPPGRGRLYMPQSCANMTG